MTGRGMWVNWRTGSKIAVADDRPDTDLSRGIVLLSGMMPDLGNKGPSTSQRRIRERVTSRKAPDDDGRGFPSWRLEGQKAEWSTLLSPSLKTRAGKTCRFPLTVQRRPGMDRCWRPKIRTPARPGASPERARSESDARVPCLKSWTPLPAAGPPGLRTGGLAAPVIDVSKQVYTSRARGGRAIPFGWPRNLLLRGPEVNDETFKDSPCHRANDGFLPGLGCNGGPEAKTIAGVVKTLTR